MPLAQVRTKLKLGAAPTYTPIRSSELRAEGIIWNARFAGGAAGAGTPRGLPSPVTAHHGRGCAATVGAYERVATGTGAAPLAAGALAGAGTEDAGTAPSAPRPLRRRRAPLSAPRADGAADFPFTGGFPSPIAFAFAFLVAAPFFAITRCALSSFYTIGNRVAMLASLALASSSSVGARP